jgi:hypothetical protein
LRQKGDFCWFFTLAHAEITKLINKNISAFQRPNALMRLNISFSEQFVRALGSTSRRVEAGVPNLRGPAEQFSNQSAACRRDRVLWRGDG